MLVLGGDHAASMIKAGKAMGACFSGDPAHAIDTVLGVVAKNLKISPVIMLARKLYRTMSYRDERLTEAFEVPKEGKPEAWCSLKRLLGKATTRWGINTLSYNILGIKMPLSLLQQRTMYEIGLMGDTPGNQCWALQLGASFRSSAVC